MQCNVCGGTGQVSFPISGGGGIEYYPCSACGGTGKQRGSQGPGFGGLAWIGRLGPPPRTPPGDPLAGRWVNQAVAVDFERSEDHYIYTEHAPAGVVAQGVATCMGQTVSIRGQHVLFGPYQLALQLDGESLWVQGNVLLRLAG